jgi:hypothetical protein
MNNIVRPNYCIFADYAYDEDVDLSKLLRELSQNLSFHTFPYGLAK